MKKWIIYLGFLSTCSAFYAEAQVYNQKFDKRFSNEIESAEDYQKHIQKLQTRLYSDYHKFLTELDFSRAYSRIELLRQDRLKRLNEIRLDLNAKVDYDQQFNDAKHEVTKDFNILIDHYEMIYKDELKQAVSLNSHVVDSLHEYKAYLKVLESQVEKAVSARENFEKNFEDLERTYDIEIEDKGDIEAYSSRERKIYTLKEKISKHEALALYYTRIYKRIITLETIDTDFRAAADSLDSLGMANTIRYQKNHSREIFGEIQRMDKFNETENELKNNALRVVKNQMSNSQKIYISILKFSQDNKKVLIQERKNQAEYDRVKDDKSNFEDKDERKKYIDNPPSQKYTEKYENLIKKYREKTESTLSEFDASYKELVDAYITKYNPINQNF